MHHYTVLRLLLCGFLLYIAWPSISLGATLTEKIFWVSWLTFLCLVIGGNLATGLNISSPPKIEEKVERVRERG